MAKQDFAEPVYRYNAALAGNIEKKWQHFWKERGTFWAANVKGNLTDGQGRHADGRPPYFVMDMFPYPSGKGLHVGHPLGYLATDVVSRFYRMQGYNVLHAMGYDAFGLPAEQYAVQTGQHPRITTEANIANMSRQLERMGLSLDDRRTFQTIDPQYVRWTQWIFSRLYDAWYDPEAVREDGSRGAARPIQTLIEQFEKGKKNSLYPNKQWADLTAKEQSDVLNEYRLAYVSFSPVNWCPGLGTVLANEEVTADGRSERGNYPVFQRHLRQWSMRITSYAQRLLDDLESIDWPEKVKLMQKNWIGRSEGAYLTFPVISSTNFEHHYSTSDEMHDKVGDLNIYTTRPDTIFGTTFAVVSPEHELLEKLPETWQNDIPSEWKKDYNTPFEAVQAYKEYAKQGSTSNIQNTEKTGQFTGLYAVNPITGNHIPIFVSDYVLANYGTGAIMAVPGGDQRDYDFAIAYNLPIIYTAQSACNNVNKDADNDEKANGRIFTNDVEKTDTQQQGPYISRDGIIINSSVQSAYADGKPFSIDGLTVEEAIAAVNRWLGQHKVGKPHVSYRLRDWLFSRQRYWGEPFPIVYDTDGIPHLIPDDLLPVNLPEVPDYQPRVFDPHDADSNPEAPLSRDSDWVEVKLDLGNGEQTYYRDTNTMPNWAGSSWYYLRYIDPNDTHHMVDPEEYDYWLGHKEKISSQQMNCANSTFTQKYGGVDLYVGGVEHAVLHLLYARFWHKALYDLGFVSSPEPFHKLFNQGMIQAYAYTDDRGQYVPAQEVQEHTDPQTSEVSYTYHDQTVYREFGKMGKSLKNIVTPDDMYDEYGADTFRLYEMSMGPLAESRPWNTKNVIGGLRFLQRLWRNVVDEYTGKVRVVDEPLTQDLLKLLNSTIEQVTEEMVNMRPNTAISRLIVLNNKLTSLSSVPKDAIEPLILMLSPITPHICEELWSMLGHTESLAYTPWPKADKAYVQADTVTAVVQIAGKVRAKLDVSPNINAEDLQTLALEAVQDRIAGKTIVKVIVKAPKIVSIVLK